MARTEGFWEKRQGGQFIQTVKNIAGLLLRGTDRYINFGSLTGASGYGIRDNNGVIEVKNASGSWVPATQADLKATFETVSKNLESYDSTFSRNVTTGKLETVSYDTGSGTIVKTLNRTSGKLSSIVLSGDTPAGIDLTKTFTRVNGKISAAVYS